MSDQPYLALKERLEAELSALKRNAAALATALERARPDPDEYDTWALASYVNDFYKHCERMSERVAVTLDGGLPQGQNWHQALLRQVADQGATGRPPLWTGSLLVDTALLPIFHSLNAIDGPLNPPPVGDLPDCHTQGLQQS